MDNLVRMFIGSHQGIDTPLTLELHYNGIIHQNLAILLGQFYFLQYFKNQFTAKNVLSPYFPLIPNPDRYVNI